MTAQESELGYQTLDIMIDVDDCITPWFETVDAKCKELGLDRLNAGPCTNWAMWEHYGCTKEEWEDAVILATLDGLYTTIEPFPGAVQAINRLRWYGHRVHIVTARGFMANGDRIRDWTREYFDSFGIGYDTLTFSKNKARAMDELGVHFDYAIDDGLHNVETLQSRGVRVFLQDAAHNRHVEHPLRTLSLWHFVEKILDDTTPLANLKGIPA